MLQLAHIPLLALFNLGGGEIILILALTLLLVAVSKPPKIGTGLKRSIEEFRKATDETAHEAGESLGGINGKSAAQALTPDNLVAELYEPAASKARPSTQGRDKSHTLARLLYKWISRFLKRLFFNDPR